MQSWGNNNLITNSSTSGGCKTKPQQIKWLQIFTVVSRFPPCLLLLSVGLVFPPPLFFHPDPEVLGCLLELSQLGLKNTGATFKMSRSWETVELQRLRDMQTLSNHSDHVGSSGAIKQLFRQFFFRWLHTFVPYISKGKTKFLIFRKTCWARGMGMSSIFSH